MTDLAWYFFIALGIYGFALIATAFLTRRYAGDVKSFALGGFWMGPFIWGFSSLATWFSISSYMGTPGIYYTYGWGYFWGHFIGASLCPVATVLFARRLRLQGEKLGALSITDYLGGRFNSMVLRVVATGTCIFYAIAFAVSQMKGLGSMMSYITGAPFWVGVIICAVIVAIYLPVGGMSAATLSDFYEGIIMCLTAVVLVPVSLMAVGGFSGLAQRLAVINPKYNSFFVDWFTPLNAPAEVIHIWVLYWASPYLSRMWLATKTSHWREYFKFNIAYLVGCLFTVWLAITGLVSRAMGVTARPPYGADLVNVELTFMILPTFFAVFVYIGIVAASVSSYEDWLHVAAVGVGHDLGEHFGEKVKKWSLTLSKITIPLVILVATYYTIIAPPPLLSIFLYHMGSVVNAVFAIPLVTGLFYKKTTKPAIFASIAASLFWAVWFWDYLAIPGYQPSPYLRGVGALVLGLIVFVIVNPIVLYLRKEKAVPEATKMLFS